MKKLIPADTVDAAGNVWETVGENIRKGAKEISDLDVKTIVDILFPVGSVYCGENAFVFSVGEWKMLTDTVSLPVYVASSVSTGEKASARVAAPPETYSTVAAIRMWKRIA